MPQIVEEVYYGGAKSFIRRLGLTPLVDEINAALTGFHLLVGERAHGNSRAAVRMLLHERFDKLGGWTKAASTGIDRTKCRTVNDTRVCVGVEARVPARGSLLVVDMLRLRSAFRDGHIDVGIVIVPGDRLSRLLSDRPPSISDARKHANAARLEDS